MELSSCLQVKTLYRNRSYLKYFIAHFRFAARQRPQCALSLSKTNDLQGLDELLSIRPMDVKFRQELDIRFRLKMEAVQGLEEELCPPFR